VAFNGEYEGRRLHYDTTGLPVKQPLELVSGIVAPPLPGGL